MTEKVEVVVVRSGCGVFKNFNGMISGERWGGGGGGVVYRWFHFMLKNIIFY